MEAFADCAKAELERANDSSSESSLTPLSTFAHRNPSADASLPLQKSPSLLSLSESLSVSEERAALIAAAAFAEATVAR